MVCTRLSISSVTIFIHHYPRYLWPYFSKTLPSKQLDQPQISLERDSGTASDFSCFLGCLGVLQCINSTSGLTLAQCIHVGMINTLMKNGSPANTWDRMVQKWIILA
mmetsp:Transcript_9933/g.17856  ORF Transcript_9933/g.17856 Transcript_9933/m.17856 type:complete len:107 (-) Transcript_9933:242-562(-)